MNGILNILKPGNDFFDVGIFERIIEGKEDRAYRTLIQGGGSLLFASAKPQR